MKLKLTLLLLATLVLFTPRMASAQEFCIPFNGTTEQVCYSGVFPANAIVIELGQPVRLPATVLKNLTNGPMTFTIEWAGIDIAGSGTVYNKELAKDEVVTLNDLAFEINGLDLGTRKIAIGFGVHGVSGYKTSIQRTTDLAVVIPGQLKEIIQIPLRYCVVEGSPQAMGKKPGETVDGKKLLSVLREANNKFWLPQAGIMFRHAFAEQGLPVVADPDPNSYNFGDLTIAGFGSLGEADTAAQHCEQAWETRFPGQPGIIVVNGRAIVGESGSTTGGIAPAAPSALWVLNPADPRTGKRGDALCGNPSKLTAADVTPMLKTATYDPALFGIIPYNEKRLNPPGVLAHELGHTLMLGHGNGLDDNGDGLLPPTVGRRRFDQYCDVLGDVEANPALPCSVMQTADCNPITPLQREMARAAARFVPGVVLPDPVASRAGTFVAPPSPCPPDCDVPTTIKLQKIGVAETPGADITNFTHTLLALAEGGTYSYSVYADLDNNPATGCPVVEVGQPQFLGAELRTLVTVNATGAGAVAVPAVWQCAGGAWVEIQDAGISASAFALSSVDHGAPVSSGGIVTLQIPNAVRGAVGTHIRVQAVAEGESKFDLLPASGTGAVISLIASDLKTCSVGPMVARPGQIVSVEANGLPASRAVDVFIGDVKAGSGTTGANGSIAIDVPVDSTAVAGVRPVEVIVQGGAAGASCAMIIQAGAVTPATTATLTPQPNANGWNNTDVTVALSAVDMPGGPGISSISYVATGAQSVPAATAPGAATNIAIHVEGQTTVSFYATNNGGVTEAAHNVTVSVDKTKPTITYAGNQGTYGLLDTVNITCTASDSLSGLVFDTCANISGPAWQFSLSGNSYTATAIDFASNINTATASFKIVVTYSDLCSLTRQFLDASNPGATVLGDSLCAQLNAAQAAAARGNATAKKKAIDAYIRQLKGTVPGFLTEVQMKILSSLAAAL